MAADEPVCARCGAKEGVKLEDSRTNYARPELDAWDLLMLDGEDPPDPNAPMLLCRPCAEEHHEYWDEMWRDYYASRG